MPPEERNREMGPGPDRSSDRAGLYRIAFDAGIRALEDQRDELNGIRTRSVGFAAIMTTGTAFLVGSGLNGVPDSQRDSLFFLNAISGTVLFVAMLGLLSWVLIPTHGFRLILDPGVLVSRWIDAEVPGPSESQMLQALAEKTLPSMIQTNEVALSRIRYAYIGAVMCGSSGLIVWITLVWSRA